MTDTPQAPRADARPLLMVGCVRSGTTLTRDLLRRVPNFICPEETHFYRWTEAFRTPQSLPSYKRNFLLKKHRKIDGVSEEDYLRVLQGSRSKAELQRHYITLYATALGITGPYRWFDKSPQNIYGAALMAQDFPDARFLHLVRNPLNVVSSLVVGRQLKVEDIHGACNYWIEAVSLAKALRKAYPKRVLQMNYEDLVDDAPTSLEAILDFAEVPYPAGLFRASDTRPEQNLWIKDLTEDQAMIVARRCGPLAKSMGYRLKAQVAEQVGS